MTPGIADDAATLEIYEKVLDDPILGPSVRRGLSQLTGIKNSTIVDMGCGKGFVSVFFALHGATVIGFDTEAKSLARAGNLAKKFNVQDRCHFFRSCSEQMPITPGSVDVVFSRSTLQYTDRWRVFEECQRILKPGGTLILNENLPYNPIINFFRLQRRLRARTPDAVGYVKSIRGYITFRDIHALETHFSQVTHSESHLFRVASLGLVSRYKDASWVKRVDRAVAALDNLLLKHFAISRYAAWMVSIVGTGKR